MRKARNVLPPSGIYHVTGRGVAYCAIFRDDTDRRLFLARFRRLAGELDVRCFVYCLMTTHFHLVLPAKLASLSAGMHWLNGIWAQRMNRRWGRTGHLFENRFSAWVIRDEEHWHATCRYVLENPAKAGLCKSALDWPWSGGRYLRRYRP